jgi:hypothetical protein
MMEQQTRPTAEQVLFLFDSPLMTAMNHGAIETPQGDIH